MKIRLKVPMNDHSPGCFSLKSSYLNFLIHSFRTLQSRKRVALVGSVCSLIFSGLISGLVAGLVFAQTIDDQRQQELDHLLKQDCGSCHGMTLNGGLGPALTQDAMKEKPRQYLFDTIFFGREALAMPPWEGLLTEDEIWWIVERLKNGDSDQ